MAITRLPAARLTSLLNGYARDAVKPFACLVFVAPMLLAYESGLLLWPRAMRNGVDVWLRHLLELLGFGHYFLLPLLTCGTLLAWHHLRRDKWRVRGSVLYGMLIESMALGFLLLVTAQLQGVFLNSLSAAETTAAAACAVGGDGGSFARVFAFFGAGIYEELLFRLLLLTSLAAVFRMVGVSSTGSFCAAVLLSSLLFAGAHYRLDLALGPWQLATSFGDTFQWTSFLFRFSAGVFFSLVFLYRGFGIAVGAHALYDILVSFS